MMIFVDYLENYTSVNSCCTEVKKSTEIISWFFAGPEGSLELAQLLVRLGQLEAAETTLANTPLTKKAFVLAKVNTLQNKVRGAKVDSWSLIASCNSSPPAPNSVATW